jgi:hypothetical protein
VQYRRGFASAFWAPALTAGLVALAALAPACATEPAPAPRSVVLFDLRADLASTEHFFDFPYPSDLRLSPAGTPDLRGIANPPGKPVLESLRTIAQERAGYPVVPVAYFRFSRPVAPRSLDDVMPAAPTSPVLLVDVDASTADRGKLFPTVATVLTPDPYSPENVVAIGARPGIVLAPRRKYAFVVAIGLGDSAGGPLGVPDAFRAPLPEVAASLAPLWETLDKLGVARTSVAAATVFTTGDVVDDTFALTTRLLEKYSVTVDKLAVDKDDGDHARYCELVGEVSFPQFQRGRPPFDTEGTFDPSGPTPAKQRDETAPITITLPKGEMPFGGYPLVMFFHGSGGLSSGMVDRGTVRVPNGPNTKAEGPAFVVAAHGFAMASSALPVNPQRLPGAEETAYLNLNNPAAMRDTFRQGVIEQRLLVKALETVKIDPGALAGCNGMTLAAGESAYHFRKDPLFAQGQSMGGMYTNLVGAVEPRIKAVVPTGAGGYWSYFITRTKLFPNASGLLGAFLLQTQAPLSFVHPALHMVETGFEPVEPMVYVPRLAQRPLGGHPVRPIYEPAGKGDSYFPTEVYDAMVLAYGHKQAGSAVWPGSQDALRLAGLEGILQFPVSQDMKAAGVGTPYTAALVQYEGDGIDDPHAIYHQLDAVKYQYGCFFASMLAKGVATIPAPAPLGTPCPM